MNGWLGRAGLLVLAIAICLGIAEVVARNLSEPTLGFHYDAPSGRFLLPREFQLNRTPNALGFHDVEVVPKPEGVRRVLLLGDSYVESYSVRASENVGQRIEAHLNAHSEITWDVVSIGKSAWGQHEELAALLEHGASLDPDLVVTLFLPLNDVENNSPRLRGRTKLQHLDPDLLFRPGQTRRGADTMPFFWFRSSVLNQLISHRLTWGLLRKHRAQPESIPIDYFVFKAEIDDDWRDAWAMSEALVVETRALAQSLGARYALAAASTPQGVLGKDAGLAVLQDAYPAMRAFEWDLDLPARRMAEICARHEIPFLDLGPSFRGATAEGRVLHWRFDGHWNAFGNEFAGERLAAFVLEVDAL